MSLSRRKLLADTARLGTAVGLVGPVLAADPPPLRLPICSAGKLVKTALHHDGPPPVPLHPERLERYVDVLPIPPLLRPSGQRADPQHAGRKLPYYRVEMRETETRVHRDVPPTRCWTYSGSMPGPTIEVRSGQGVLIEWVNALPEKHFLPIDHSLHGAGPDVPEVRTVVHVHGAKAPPASDGFPDDWVTRGHSQLAYYPNQQDATMLWYHDHAMGIARLNHYAGLFGTYLIRDEVEDALDLPKGPYEIPLMLCDRLFNADGQLNYPISEIPGRPWIPEVYGDAMLVNGKLFPYLEVEPRLYRFRVVNASNTRFFYLELSNRQTFFQVGSDQGLLPQPVPLSKLVLAPAERADLIVDFSAHAGEKLLLMSQAIELMQFRVGDKARESFKPLPAKLRPVPRMPESAAVHTRHLQLNEYLSMNPHRMQMLLDGKYWHDPVSERPVLGSVEIWNLVNLTEDTHPIHLHLVRFQILDRHKFDADEFLTSGKMIRLGEPVPPDPNEAGWKDTARAQGGLVTRIIVRFEGYVGRYVWHCHLWEHAANEMMRPFEVIAPKRK